MRKESSREKMEDRAMKWYYTVPVLSGITERNPLREYEYELKNRAGVQNIPVRDVSWRDLSLAHIAPCKMM